MAGAPRALRIGAARQDYFPIEGTRRTVEEARRVYKVLGAEDRIDLFEADGQHGYSQALRQAAYQWFHLWLGNPSADSTEPPVQPEPPEALWATPGGQVNRLGSRTVFCFTRDLALGLPPAMPALATRGEAEEWQDGVRTRLRELLGCLASSGAPYTRQHGALFRGSMGIERLSFQSEHDITIPALLFVPDKEAGQWPGILYVHEDGKEAEADHLGAIHMLAAEGNVVLAIDVRGVGETRSIGNIGGDYRFMGIDGYHHYQYGMLGHSLLGRRVHDVLRAVAVLIERPEVSEERVSVVGQGAGGLLALLAAALDERIATTACCQGLASWRAIATHEFHNWHPSLFLPGVLRHFDLPQIAACVAPRRLVLAGPVDHMRRRMAQAEAERLYAPARALYDLFNEPEAVDRIMAGDCEVSLAIRHHDVLALPDNPEADLLKSSLGAGR